MRFPRVGTEPSHAEELKLGWTTVQTCDQCSPPRKWGIGNHTRPEGVNGSGKGDGSRWHRRRDCRLCASFVIHRRSESGIPDAREISQGMVPDCNAHGVPDSCDIANGMRDKNAEGHPDECSYAYGAFDLDGMIGAAGLAARLSRRSLCLELCKLDCSNF